MLTDPWFQGVLFLPQGQETTFLPLPGKPRGVVCVLGGGEFSVPPARQLVLLLHLQRQRVREWALGWSPGAAALLCPSTEVLQSPASGGGSSFSVWAPGWGTCSPTWALGLCLLTCLYGATSSSRCGWSGLSWKSWSLFEIPFTWWPCNLCSLMGSRKVMIW